MPFLPPNQQRQSTEGTRSNFLTTQRGWKRAFMTKASSIWSTASIVEWWRRGYLQPFLYSWKTITWYSMISDFASVLLLVSHFEHIPYYPWRICLHPQTGNTKRIGGLLHNAHWLLCTFAPVLRSNQQFLSFVSWSPGFHLFSSRRRIDIMLLYTLNHYVSEVLI